jgi:hypothetical protein
MSDNKPVEAEEYIEDTPKPAAKAAEPEEVVQAVEVEEVVEPEAPRIQSIDDAKEVFFETVDKVRDKSADEIRESALKGINSLFDRFRKIVD